MKLKYRIKKFDDFTLPYWKSDFKNDQLVNHVYYDEYETYDKDIFYSILNDFIDAPKKKLTKNDVKHDFESSEQTLSENNINKILTYYNGRFDLSKKINNDIKKAIKNVKMNFPIVLKYNISFEMNYFSYADDEYDSNISMNKAYIEIELSYVL